MLTKKQIRLLVKSISPSPGYITCPTTNKPFTRAEFETLFDTLEPEVDIMDELHGTLGNSVSKRLEYFLRRASDEHIDIILGELNK